MASKKVVSEMPNLKERQQFRTLLLSNPNYFGNLEKSPFKSVLQIQSNSSYEELGSVGLQTQFNRLEAVVFVKQPSGYSGGICSDGSQEYVRFYISYDNGSSWQDLGMSSFTAYDVPQGTQQGKRLEYDVSMDIKPPQKWCFVHNFARVRAILSWNDPPPPNSPNHKPVWGDIHNTVVQIEGIKQVKLWELFHEAKFKLPSNLESILDTQQSVSLAKNELSLQELQQTYKGKVEPHRFALKEIQQLVQHPSFSLQATSLKELLPGIDLKIGDLLDQLFPKDGNTSYEELECVGYNPVLDTLAGVIRVKKTSGYSGGPCTKGSREYVAFWADLNNNGTYETYLGTTSVSTYDFNDTPREGLEYAVFLPANLRKYRKPCQQGPVLIPIRAILSWNVAPNPTEPNQVPVWGNREDTLVLVDPGNVLTGHAPVIETVGSMKVSDISSLTGLASGPSPIVGFTATDSPFGGEVVIRGRIANPPDISAGATKLKYRIELSNDNGASWNQFVRSDFSLGRLQLLGGVWSFLPDVLQKVDANNYYDYQEDLSAGPANPQIFAVGEVLGRWQTAGLSGKWMLRVRVLEPTSMIQWVSSNVTVMLDNAAPNGGLANVLRPHLTIDTRNGVLIGSGACEDFTIGDVIGGAYEVRDAHLGSLGIGLEPVLGGGGSFRLTSPVVVGPSAGSVSKSYPSLPSSGETGRWEFNTAGLPKCGYVIRITSSDRTIINSGSVGFYNDNVIGLCLRKPGT